MQSRLLGKLNDMGEYVKSASSTLETPVVRRVSDYVTKNSDAPAAKAPKPGKPAPKPGASVKKDAKPCLLYTSPSPRDRG